MPSMPSLRMARRMNLPIDKPRAVTAIGGEKRWACRACARTHAARHGAEQCCAETVDPDWLAGGELLPRGHRTQREVLDQLEIRMAELEKEAARRKEAPPSKYPCATCKWRDEVFSHHCTQPLVKGFEKEVCNVDWQLVNCRGLGKSNWPTAALCGIEKALWEPRQDQLEAEVSKIQSNHALSAAKFQGAALGVLAIAIIYLLSMAPAWL